MREICDREFRGETRRYYVLVPKSEPHTTILDPVESVQQIGLHDVMTPEQADQILTFVSTAQLHWITDNSKRRNAYTETIKFGSLTDMAMMIKELLVHGRQAPLNQHDKTMLRCAQKKLLSEIALAKEIDFDSALELMNRATAS